MTLTDHFTRSSDTSKQLDHTGRHGISLLSLDGFPEEDRLRYFVGIIRRDTHAAYDAKKSDIAASKTAA